MEDDEEGTIFSKTQVAAPSVYRRRGLVIPGAATVSATSAGEKSDDLWTQLKRTGTRKVYYRNFVKLSFGALSYLDVGSYGRLLDWLYR